MLLLALATVAVSVSATILAPTYKLSSTNAHMLLLAFRNQHEFYHPGLCLVAYYVNTALAQHIAQNIASKSIYKFP